MAVLREKADARLRIEPFGRLTREQRAETVDEAERLATFLVPEMDVRVELERRTVTT
jgi:hypothetical protein